MKTEKTTEALTSSPKQNLKEEMKTSSSDKTENQTIPPEVEDELNVRLRELNSLVDAIGSAITKERQADEICKLAKAVIEVQVHRATLLNPAPTKPDVQQLAGVFNTLQLLQERIANLEQLLGEPASEPEDNGREQAIRQGFIKKGCTPLIGKPWIHEHLMRPTADLKALPKIPEIPEA